MKIVFLKQFFMFKLTLPKKVNKPLIIFLMTTTIHTNTILGKITFF